MFDYIARANKRDALSVSLKVHEVIYSTKIAW